MDPKDKQPLNPPPLAAEHLLNWVLPAHLKDAVIGDLAEEYAARIKQLSAAEAKRWYWRQTVSTVIHFFKHTQRGFMMFLFSLLVFISAGLFAMVFSGGLSTFIDVSSMILVFPSALLFGIAATSWRDVKQALLIPLGGGRELSDVELQTAQRAVSVIGNSAVWLGVFSSLIGAVAIGAHLDDLSVFGSAFAVSILVLVYGIGLKIVCYLIEMKIGTVAMLRERGAQ